jgi:hypothetical protein
MTRELKSIGETIEEAIEAYGQPANAWVLGDDVLAIDFPQKHVTALINIRGASPLEAEQWAGELKLRIMRARK